MSKETTKLEVKGIIKEETEKITTIMTGVIIALFIAAILGLIGLGAILQSYLAYKQATYQNLVDKITEQNIKINLLYSSLDKTNTELGVENNNLTILKKYFGIK